MREESHDEYFDHLRRKLKFARRQLRKIQNRNKEFGIKLSTKKAWLNVAMWYEELGKLIPAGTPEGKRVRLKSVRAAWKARDIVLAQKLFEAYLKSGELNLEDIKDKQIELVLNKKD